MGLPPYVSREIVGRRLDLAFPEGSEFRQYAVRPSVEATVFTMLYIGAVGTLEGAETFCAPKHIYLMGDNQAKLATDAERIHYAVACAKPGYQSIGQPWYAVNTREPIRDEGIRQFLLSVGAGVTRKDLPTTSPKGRYKLTREFAALFDPRLSGAEFEAAATAWSKRHLSAEALARIELVRAQIAGEESGMMVEFPNKGGSRPLEAGTSSMIAKAVIEEFAPRFLRKPAVLWLSQSGHKVVARDDVLAKKIGLEINQGALLPDIILVDIDERGFFIVFVEVVASDGPITTDRRAELRKLAGRYHERSMAFVTAFLDRDRAEFKRVFNSLAFNSFAWVASEPQKIVALYEGKQASKKLSELVNFSDDAAPQ